MSRSNRYLKGLAGNYVSQAIILLAGLWLTRFLLSHLGADEFGRWLIVLQVLTTLELADLGVMAVLPREVAFRTGGAETPESDRSSVRDLLSAARRVSLWQLPIVAAAAVLLWVVVLGARLDHPATLPLAVAALCYIVTFPLRVYNAALSGLQDLLFLSAAGTGLWLCQSIVTVIMVACGMGFWSLLGGWAAGRFFNVAACRWRLGLAFPNLAPAALGRRHSDNWRLLRSGLWISFGNLAYLLKMGTDVIILGMLSGPAVVVVYTCTAKLSQIATNQLVGLLNGAGPALAEISTAGSVESRRKAYTALSQFVMVCVAGASAVLLAVNGAFVNVWVGQDKNAGQTVTALLVAVMVARHAAATFSTLLFWMGHERFLPVIYFGDGLVTVGCTALLALPFGALAAPAGSLAGVFVALPAYVWLLSRDPNFAAGTFLRAHMPLLWRAGLVLAAAAAVAPWVPARWGWVIATTLVVGALYAAVMFPAVRHTPIWPYVHVRAARPVNWLLSKAALVTAYWKRRRIVEQAPALVPEPQVPALAPEQPAAATIR
jgi:O-antigen/teichoic acid export membrane protein